MMYPYKDPESQEYATININELRQRRKVSYQFNQEDHDARMARIQRDKNRYKWAARFELAMMITGLIGALSCLFYIYWTQVESIKLRSF